MYSANNPINAFDLDGRDIIFLLDEEGASWLGHGAVLIGNDDDGWELFSKEGTADNEKSGLYGDSKSIRRKFDTFDDFIKNTADEIVKYDKAIRFNPDEVWGNGKAAEEELKNELNDQISCYYNITENSCNNTMKRAAFKLGIRTSYTIPKWTFNEINSEGKNRNSYIYYDLNYLRNPIINVNSNNILSPSSTLITF